jgi:mono/diheme cytochrome c family protein
MTAQRSHRHGLTVIPALLMSTAPVNAADYRAMSGEQLYVRFCASCHGTEGHGDGPVAQSFARPIPDLTLIARRHGGKFQREWVERTIDGRQKIASHGAYAMPVWGEDFSQTGDPDAERATRTMIARLVDYLETLQQK